MSTFSLDAIHFPSLTALTSRPGAGERDEVAVTSGGAALCGCNPAGRGGDRAAGVAGALCAGDRTIVAGLRVGFIRLGMRYAEVCSRIGEGETAASQRLGFARYPQLGLELVLATPFLGAPAGNARVISVGVRGANGWLGAPRPGDERARIEEVLGPATAVGARSLYCAGASVEYDADGRVSALAIFAPFVDSLWPAPMARSLNDGPQ